MRPPRGLVTFTETDPRTGAIVRSFSKRNSYTDAFAGLTAQVVAAGAGSLALSHVGLGCGGADIGLCESIAGWASAPTLDVAVFAQGTASLSMTQALSTSGTYANPMLTAAVDASAVGSAIELSMRLTLRGRFDLANSKLLIYTGGTTVNGYSITFAGIETAMGVPFQDGTWKIARIPITSFTAFGAPSWTSVTGAGFTVAANASGSATVNVDDIRLYPPALPYDHTQTAVANRRTLQPVSTVTFTAPGTVTATAYWTAGELAGTFYLAGLYGNVGATLAAILPVVYTKSPNFNLSVTWALTFAGG